MPSIYDKDYKKEMADEFNRTNNNLNQNLELLNKVSQQLKDKYDDLDVKETGNVLIIVSGLLGSVAVALDDINERLNRMEPKEEN